MAYRLYTDEEYTETTRLLLEMRDNCLKEYPGGYEDPKKKQKADALNIAMECIDMAWNIAIEARGHADATKEG